MDFSKPDQRSIQNLNRIANIASIIIGVQINLEHAFILHLCLRYRNEPLPAITVSIGTAEAADGETDPAALLSRADAALYQAKAQGRNRVVVTPNQGINV